MPFAIAMSCDGSASGLANIDLTGTPFAVVDPFKTGGSVPHGVVTVSNAGQTLAVTGGGDCGWNGPTTAPFNPFNAIASTKLALSYVE